MANKKIGKILYVGVDNKFYSSYQTFYLVLKKLSEDFICFDFRMNNLLYGGEVMNKMFLDLVEKERPQFIFFMYFPDDLKIDTILKIRDISPDSTTMLFFGDDDALYDCYSRYFQLLFDYCIVFQKQILPRYKEDAATNTFASLGTNLDVFRPMKVEKKYDVVFIGIPEFDRYEYLKFLIENGIKVKIFGRGWHDYPEFKEYYGGALTHEDLVKTLNESRIVLCFSKNLYGVLHFKGRIFETAACRSFMLVEYFSEYEKIFKKDKEMVMFKDKDELLKKINYYLVNVKEREEVVDRAYKNVLKNFDFTKDLHGFFTKLQKNKVSHRPLPKTDKKIIELTKQDIILPLDILKEKIDSYDYICFNDRIIKKNTHKEFFQIYSLEKSKKPISCCNCYIGNKRLGDYLYYSSFNVFNKNIEDFYRTVNISQIALTKEFFLDNVERIKKMFDDIRIDIITKENTSFIEIPLITIPKMNLLDYKEMKTYLLPKFFNRLYSLKHQKKLFKDPYVYWLGLEILKGNFFLLYLIKGTLNDTYYKMKVEEMNK